MSKIDSRFVSRAQIYPQAADFVVFGKIYIRNGNSFFAFSKIAEEKVQNVSFHNHMVARCHIKNRWRRLVPNIAHFMGGIYLGLLKQLFGSDSGSFVWANT